MDDYKRSIYIEVQRRLRLPWSKSNQRHICYLLQDILEQDGFDAPTKRQIKALFPEFYKLFDGYCYTKINSGKIIEEKANILFDSWCYSIVIKPRIRIIDYLLQT